MRYFAYLDPGTGSLIAQALIGGAVAVGVIVKTYWHKIIGVFKKGGKKQTEDLRD